MSRIMLTQSQRDILLLVIFFFGFVFSFNVSLFLIIIAALTGSEILLLFWHYVVPHLIFSKKDF